MLVDLHAYRLVPVIRLKALVIAAGGHAAVRKSDRIPLAGIIFVTWGIGAP